MADLEKIRAKIHKQREQAAEDRKKRKQAGSEDRQSVPFIKWVDGETKILRLCPPKKPDGHILVRRWTHWNLGPDGAGFAECPEMIDPNAYCPIEERIQDLGYDSDFYKKFGRRGRYYSQVVDVENPDEGPFRWSMQVKSGEELLPYLDDMDYLEDLISLGKGKNIEVTRSGSGMDTAYSIKIAPKSTVLFESEEEIEAIMEAMLDLDEYLQHKFTPKQMMAFVHGELSPLDILREENEDTEVPTRRKK